MEGQDFIFSSGFGPVFALYDLPDGALVSLTADMEIDPELDVVSSEMGLSANSVPDLI